MNLTLWKNTIKEKSLIFAWGLYDFANQVFALNIVSLYFVRWIIIDKQTPELFYGICLGCSLILVAFLAPLLGSISDSMHRRRFFLVLFTLLSIVFTISLGLTGSVLWALIFFAIANFGCQIAIIFYNALLINIAPANKVGLVSGVGRMLGYCGAVLGLLIVHPLVQESGRQAAFIPSGLIFLIFALPCMLFIKDEKSNRTLSILAFLKKQRLKLFFKQFLKQTLDLVKSANLSNFLKATFFCLCVVNTIIVFMSVYVTQVFALSESQIFRLILFSTVFAILGSISSGYISDRIGHQRSLIIVFLLWGICLLAGAIIRNPLFYWFIGPMVGVALGSTWVVSRALVIHIVSADKIGEVFGLFFLISLISTAVGVFFWSGLLWFLSRLGTLGYRFTLASLFFFLLPGFIYARRIKA
jgi:UMF1 family MFS transporter